MPQYVFTNASRGSANPPTVYHCLQHMARAFSWIVRQSGGDHLKTLEINCSSIEQSTRRKHPKMKATHM